MHLLRLVASNDSPRAYSDTAQQQAWKILSRLSFDPTDLTSPKADAPEGMVTSTTLTPKELKDIGGEGQVDERWTQRPELARALQQEIMAILKEEGVSLSQYKDNRKLDIINSESGNPHTARLYIHGLTPIQIIALNLGASARLGKALVSGGNQHSLETLLFQSARKAAAWRISATLGRPVNLLDNIFNECVETAKTVLRSGIVLPYQSKTGYQAGLILFRSPLEDFRRILTNAMADNLSGLDTNGIMAKSFMEAAQAVGEDPEKFIPKMDSVKLPDRLRLGVVFSHSVAGLKFSDVRDAENLLRALKSEKTRNFQFL